MKDARGNWCEEEEPVFSSIGLPSGAHLRSFTKEHDEEACSTIRKPVWQNTQPPVKHQQRFDHYDTLLI